MSCIPVTVTDVVLSRSQRIRKGRVLTCGGGGNFLFYVVGHGLQIMRQSVGVVGL